jgi:hypothetical protein
MTAKTKKGAVAIQSLIACDKGMLAALCQRASELRVFQDKLKAKLSPPLCDHFILANIDDNTLTIHTDSSAWAARLRFKTPDILSHIQELCGANSPLTIRIKVAPPAHQNKTALRTIKLSNKNAQLIQDAANSITDPVLRGALLKLAQGKSQAL